LVYILLISGNDRDLRRLTTKPIEITEY